MEEKEYNELKKISKSVRKNIIDIIYKASSGHPGGALSIADILVVLYFKEMNVDSNNPKLENRDRLVLSKGHASAGLYAVLSEKGFFKKEELSKFRKIDGMLQGHPDMKKIPGVDMTTGSLGQGLSASVGMALAGKLDNKEYRVYCITGDGELGEGQIWEAAMSASHYKLDNLCLIVDNNNLQIDGEISKVMNSYPITEKFKSFGFNVLEIDGHNYEEIINALEMAKKVKNKPTAIIAKTVKGKGVSFMENNADWHGKAPNEEQYSLAMKEFKSE